jgi:hypothetical protein
VPLSYQDRSSIRSIALQIVQKFIDRHHRFTRWGTAPNRDRRRHPSLPEGVQQKRVRQHRAPGGARRAYFRNNSITIGDQNGLAAGGKPNVFTQFVLKDFDANGPHSRYVATESYFVKTPVDGNCQGSAKEIATGFFSAFRTIALASLAHSDAPGRCAGRLAASRQLLIAFSP